MERAELARRLAATAAAHSDDFMRGFAAAVARGGAVFVVDPAWDERRRETYEKLRSQVEATSEHGWLMIPSGGTSGGLKFARHDQDTIEAAVGGFRAHFGMTRVNAVGVLPLHHVSGLMAWMRCALTGGNYMPWSWPDLQAGQRPGIAGEDWVISLVPTQLQRLLADAAAVAWLRRFRIIFVGGGPVWPALAEAAASAGLPLSLSYGMTETAAMVTALRPAEFLAGARSSGAPLPHARVSVTAEGVVRIAGASVFRGYAPAWREAREFTTEDLGEFDAGWHLRVLGRRDAMIITGGKKVQPTEVEAALLQSGEFADVAVLGVPDAEWGEAVVACYPAGGREPDLARAVAALAGAHRPKRFVALADWPRHAQGKLDRARLAAAIALSPG